MSRKYNDLDLKRWKEYTDIYTDSLWIIEKRDNSGVHNGEYHGNFIPQLPYQLFSRYTKKGDWILDPFAGSGTSLIEAQRLLRNSIGIELQEDVGLIANNYISAERNENIVSEVVVEDSATINMQDLLNQYEIDNFQFIIFHPPYWDMIKFSDNKDDLSNKDSFDDFLSSFNKVIKNTTSVLEKNRYCALVIGDKYQNKQVVPLGFHCMNLFLEQGFLLKAILVKNFGDTKGKANKQGIWRYRALANDFYIFKHEYIFVFKKI